MGKSGKPARIFWRGQGAKAGAAPTATTPLIPAEHTKTDSGWVVPLPPIACDLFHALQEIAAELQSPWVLPGKDDKHLSDKALNRAVQRLLTLEVDGQRFLPIESFVVHDLRRTARTWLSKLKVQPHIAERCLNHSLGPMEEVYDHNTFISERREALEKWADWMDLVVAERENVSRLGSGAA